MSYVLRKSFIDGARHLFSSQRGDDGSAGSGFVINANTVNHCGVETADNNREYNNLETAHSKLPFLACNKVQDGNV